MFLDHWNSDPRRRKNISETNLLHKCNLLGGDFVDEIKPAVTEKFEFEDRDESKILAFFGFFGQSTI